MIRLDPLVRLRLQRGAEHLHALGPRATAPHAGYRRLADGISANSPIISFDSRQVRDRPCRAVVEALRQAHPEVFTEDGTL
jgi:hypothetical protein